MTAADRDRLVSDLWDERHNGISWTAGQQPKPKRTTPPPGGYPDVRRDSDIATARRRRELIEASSYHPTPESEAQ